MEYKTEWGNIWRVDHQGDVEMEVSAYCGNGTEDVYLTKKDIEKMLKALQDLTPPKE